MSIHDLNEFKTHIKSVIRTKTNQWIRDMYSMADERGLLTLSIQVIEPKLRYPHRGLQIWRGNACIDICVFTGLVRSDSYALAKYEGYDGDLVRSKVHVTDIVSNYIEYHKRSCQNTDEHIINYLQYVIDVWNSYNKTFKK